MRRFNSLVLLFLMTLAGALYAAEPAVDTSSIKAVTAEIAGRTGPAAEKTEAAITAALKDPAILTVMQEFSQTRKAFLVDRKKAPAERDASLEKRYQQSLGTTVDIVRKAIVSQDASLAAGLSEKTAEAASSPKDGGVSGAIRVVAVELIGQAKLTDEESKKVESAIVAAAADPKIQAGLQQVGQLRGVYLEDRKKFSAERNPKIKQSFQKALDETTAAVRSGVIAKDASIEPLINGSKKAQEYEGEGALDSAARNKLAVKPIKDVPGLPRVLLIGDSVSIGYTLNVRALLEGKANVHRIPVNGGATEVGLANMKEWLRGEKWDVIHFNFGLHDAKFASETTQRASREQYADNLRELIKQMKATGAKLIFATTTPVPHDGNISPTRRFDSIPARNEVARKVMEENGVAIDDLYALILPVRDQVGRANDVHFEAAGYELIAKQVAASIEAQLPGAGKTTP